MRRTTYGRRPKFSASAPLLNNVGSDSGRRLVSGSSTGLCPLVVGGGAKRLTRLVGGRPMNLCPVQWAGEGVVVFSPTYCSTIMFSLWEKE